jgi:hypothetical protein
MVMLASVLAISASELSSGQSNKPKGVTISLSEIASQAVHEKTFKVFIRNSDSVTAFFPRQGASGDEKIATLQLELLQTDGAWSPLPVHRELDPTLSKPLKIEPGATYESEITIDNPYRVSAWIAYPKQPYEISIKGKLRIKVQYFLGQDAWTRYASGPRQTQKSAEPNNASAGQTAFSEPIELGK